MQFSWQAQGSVRLRGVAEVTFRGTRSTLCVLEVWQAETAELVAQQTTSCLLPCKSHNTRKQIQYIKGCWDKKVREHITICDASVGQRTGASMPGEQRTQLPRSICRWFLLKLKYMCLCFCVGRRES